MATFVRVQSPLGPAHLQVVVGAEGVSLYVEAVEEQGDGAALRSHEHHGAVGVERVDVGPARALQVAVGLLVGAAAA